VHQYTINWDALHKGEPSIGVQIDANGDKIFEQVIIVQPPIASFIFSPISALTNESIEFDASESHDVDGEIISYKWNFGDGIASTGKIVTHTYTDPGEYKIVLAVIDDNGLLTTYSKAIQVEQGKEGGFPTWAWICIGLVIGIVIAFGVWRYNTAKGFFTRSQK
jgi:PKD repeat protein